MDEGAQLSKFLIKAQGRIWHFCPACKDIHGFVVDEPFQPNQRWTFDGNAEAPTFSPSMLCRTTFGDEREKKICHYFLRAGIIEFLNDSTHALAGQNIPIPEMPEKYKSWF